MDTLARFSPSMLIAGGALMTVLLVVMVMAPMAPSLYGFFVVAPLLGLGAIGLLRSGGLGNGRLARASAWAAAAGGFSVVIVGLYAIATDQFVAAAGVGGDDPLAIPFMVTSMSWMLGSLGVALALVRQRTVPPIGGWLVLGGTVSAIVLGTVLGMVAPDLAAIPAIPFGLGWVVVGRDLGRSAAPVGVRPA